MIRIEHLFLTTALCLAPVAAQAATCQDTVPQPTVVQLARDAGQFTTLLAAVQAAGLTDTLSGKGPFTIFAPTDAAFAKLGKHTLADLLKPENKARLTTILTYHVVAGAVPAAKVVTLTGARSLQGSELPIAVADGKVRVGNAQVVKTDLQGSNGVVHVVDSVLLPPNLVEVAKAAGSFQTLLQAAVAAGLADTLAEQGPFTIFAPTDEAFAKLGKDTLASLLRPENRAQLVTILKHHVVAGAVPAATAVKLHEATTLADTRLPLRFDGKTLHVGNAKVVTTDVFAGNGVIHVVDSVLLPPAN